MPQILQRIAGRVQRTFRGIALGRKSAGEVFTDIYKKNAWGSGESVSGPGSDLPDTEAVRAALPGLLRELGVKSMLDAPCGDFHWMRTVDLSSAEGAGGVEYIGGDIVADLIAANEKTYAKPGVSFRVLNIADNASPKVDLIMCRDCLVHLPLALCRGAIANFKRSGSTWLLTTTFPGGGRNKDITPGDWRPIDLQAPPFNFPAPERLIDERSRFSAVKRLGLWRLADLPEIG